MIVVILGTRPEVTKLCSTIKALKNPYVISLNQSKDLTPNTLKDLGVEVNEIIEDRLVLISRLVALSPEWVVVQGDTFSALDGAVAAKIAGCKVAHVEAGLRSGSYSDPFPEEGVRILVDRLADIHFAPTENCRKNLESEGLFRVEVVGSTTIDMLKKNLVLVTMHRNGCLGLEEVEAAQKERPDLSFLYIQHPNMKAISNTLTTIDPLPYFDFINLMKEACLVISDSGGLQEECVALGIPMLLMRKRTEWVEGVSFGAVRLGSNIKDILGMLDDIFIYGYGGAGEKIATFLEEDYGV